MRKIFLVIMSLFIGIISTNASACSNEEIVKLKKEASLIKVAYEEKEEKYEEGLYGNGEGDTVAKYYLFNVSFVNINENYYLTFTNDHDKKETTINYGDTNNGIYSFDWAELDEVTKINYKVYTSSNTPCPNETVFIGAIVLPKYNPASSIGLCQKAKELPECQKYITKDYNIKTQYKNIEDYVNKKYGTEANKKWYQLTWDFIKKHIIIFAFGLVVVIGAVTFVIIRNRKRRDEI